MCTNFTTLWRFRILSTFNYTFPSKKPSPNTYKDTLKMCCNEKFQTMIPFCFTLDHGNTAWVNEIKLAHNKVCSLNHTMLPQHVKRMFIIQLCYHFSAIALKKKHSLCTKANGPLNYFLGGQTSHYKGNSIITRLGLFAFPPPTTYYNVKRKIIFFLCLHHIHMD